MLARTKENEVLLSNMCSRTCSQCDRGCIRPKGHKGSCRCGLHYTALITLLVQLETIALISTPIAAGQCEFKCDYGAGCQQKCVREKGHPGFCNCGRHTQFPIPTAIVVTILYALPLLMGYAPCRATHAGCGGHCQLKAGHLGSHCCGKCDTDF